MIVRSCKHILRGILFETTSSYLAPSISHFINCFLGTPPPTSSNYKGRRSTQKNKKKKKPQQYHHHTTTGSGRSRVIVPAFSYTSSSLWTTIYQSVQERFQYDLPEDIRSKLSTLSTLRNFCQKMGITIASKDYEFGSEHPFQPEDILDLYPVVKHSLPKYCCF